jgi:transcriptional regulator with XRE-family HTH domain
MDLRPIFAMNLRRLRHERGFTQEAMANEAHIGRPHLSNVERGAVYAGLELIGKLCEVLNVEPAEFFRPPTPRARKR